MARNSLGLKIPFSVIMAVIKCAGVTSKAGFQHEIPESSNQYSALDKQNIEQQVNSSWDEKTKVRPT